MKNKINWRKIITIFVLGTLILSVVYAFINVIRTSNGMAPIFNSGNTNADYTLMVIQCTLGIIVMFLPSMLSAKFKIELPSNLYLGYLLFLYCSIFLGEVQSFYYRVPHWDTILHIVSGGMLGSLGFSVVQILNEHENIKVQLSPVFVALFAFCFAMALGSVWEIYEFSCDGALRLNMQKYLLPDGTPKIGRAALMDTMKDIIVDAIGAFIITVLQYLSIIKKSGRKSVDIENL